MSNDTLLFVSIAGYALVACVALLLNDGIHRYAHRQQRKHYEHMLANMAMVLDALQSSNQTLFAQRERDQQAADLSEFEEVVSEAQTKGRV